MALSRQSVNRAGDQPFDAVDRLGHPVDMCHPSRDTHYMEVRIDTPKRFLEHNHRLMAYCRTYEPRSEISLHQHVLRGRGGVSITGLQPRCRKCGDIACKQVMPPSPMLDCNRGYGAR